VRNAAWSFILEIWRRRVYDHQTRIHARVCRQR
jgi:hypothetical protein